MEEKRRGTSMLRLALVWIVVVGAMIEPIRSKEVRGNDYEGDDDYYEDHQPENTSENTPTDPDDISICYTESCARASSEIMKNMDVSVKPCDNFYDFVCGGLQKADVVEDKGLLQKLSDANTKQVLDLLDKPGLMFKNTANFKIYKQLMTACMGLKNQTTNGITELAGILKNVGGMPLIEGDRWNATAFDFHQALIKLMEYGTRPTMFFEFGVEPNIFHPSKNLLSLSPATVASLGFIHTDQMGRTLGFGITGFNVTMNHVLPLFGVKSDDIHREMPNVLEFAKKLFKATQLPTLQNFSTRSYINHTVQFVAYDLESLSDTYPGINWKLLIDAAVQPEVFSKPDQIAVPFNMDNFYHFFQENVLNANETQKRTIANYMMATIITKYAFILNEEVQTFILALFKGKTIKPALCKLFVQERIPEVLPSLYIRLNRNTKTINAVKVITEHIYETFKVRISLSDWMDNKTLTAAIQKVGRIKRMISYDGPEFKYDFLKGPVVNPKAPLASFLKANKHMLRNAFGFLHKSKQSLIRRHLYDIAVGADAFYNPQLNTIAISQGILPSSLLFRRNNQKYNNYAGIGSVIGHELAHSLDSQGALFDADGVFRNWWTPETFRNFQKKLRCFIDQYNGFYDAEANMTVNGEQTLGENVADNLGFLLAYETYLRWEKENEEEARLPGLSEYDPHQLFWISETATWCDKPTVESKRRQMMTDPHAPNRYRVIGTLQNLKEFARDFNCPNGSYMNPDKKCKIW